MSEFDLLNLVALPVLFGLVGFVEPCSIAPWGLKKGL